MDEKKRAPKCSGCGWKHSDHSFDQVGPYCAGPETEQHDNLIDDPPMIKTQVKPAVKFRPHEQGEPNEKKMSDQLENSSESDDEDHEIALLQERLQNLSIHEEKSVKSILSRTSDTRSLSRNKIWKNLNVQRSLLTPKEDPCCPLWVLVVFLVPRP